MSMTFKRCAYCFKEAWHNALAGKEKEEKRWRCTYCGHPPTSNPFKREHQEKLRDRQATKARIGGY